eukprot:TRINITY_DN41901_c0_g1_i1.p1 TRINITY_DN41901_c0_g1~~TRINITY_DN41901_c0_g1_i1.p1  ORF type:complete len:489 (+),score=101.32 TRINITY_DN41901_c0_g1_i1:65-1531(+)
MNRSLDPSMEGHHHLRAQHDGYHQEMDGERSADGFAAGWMYPHHMPMTVHPSAAAYMPRGGEHMDGWAQESLHYGGKPVGRRGMMRYPGQYYPMQGDPFSYAGDRAAMVQNAREYYAMPPEAQELADAQHRWFQNSAMAMSDAASAYYSNPPGLSSSSMSPPMRVETAALSAELYPQGGVAQSMHGMQEQWQAEPSEADSYCAAIEAAGAAGEWRKAVQLLNELPSRGQVLNTSFYNAAINACGKASEWREALRLVGEMQESGVAMDGQTYHVTMSACKSGSEWQTTVRLLKEMQAKGLAPSLLTYNLAMTACESSRKWRLAVKLLGECREQTKKMGTPMDPSCYNAAIRACGVTYQWGEALKLMQELTDSGAAPGAVSYSAAMYACAKKHQWERALHLFQDIEKQGLDVDAVAYSAAIYACGKGSQWEGALRIHNEMPSRGVARDGTSYTAAIGAVQKGQQWKVAAQLLIDMLAEGIKPNNAVRVGF